MNNPLALAPHLLAAATRSSLDGFGRHFRGEYSNYRLHDAVGITLMVSLAVVGVLVLVRLLIPRREETYHHSQRLFRDLCELHRLDAAARALLMELAQHHALSQPTFLFLQPERFVVDRLGPSWQSRRAEVEAVAAVLFADSSRTPPPDPTAAEPA